MECPYCKKELSDGATFCPECGQIIQQQETSRNASQSYWNDYKTNAEKDENERKALEARALGLRHNPRTSQCQQP